MAIHSKVGLWKMTWCIERSYRRSDFSFFFLWQETDSLSSTMALLGSERRDSTISSLLLWFVRPVTEATTFTAAILSGLSRMWHVELVLCVFVCVCDCLWKEDIHLLYNFMLGQLPPPLPSTHTHFLCSNTIAGLSALINSLCWGTEFKPGPYFCTWGEGVWERNTSIKMTPFKRQTTFTKERWV